MARQGVGGQAVIRFEVERFARFDPFALKAVQIPECEECHENVKRITMYLKTGPSSCETDVADLEEPIATSTSDENERGRGTGETRRAFSPAYGRSWQSRRGSHDALN